MGGQRHRVWENEVLEHTKRTQRDFRSGAGLSSVHGEFSLALGGGGKALKSLNGNLNKENGGDDDRA